MMNYVRDAMWLNEFSENTKTLTKGALSNGY